MNAESELTQESLLNAVLRPSNPWLPELTKSAVQNGWDGLHRHYGIQQGSYSTSAVLGFGSGDFRIPDLLPIPCSYGKFSISIEILTEAAAKHFASEQYRFVRMSDVVNDELVAEIRKALDVVAWIPELYMTSSRLTRVIHLLKSNEGDCDISFSDPRLPFSIFVSMPNKGAINALLRLAEAIIHESMHLQLSLLETIAPISASSATVYYSPWKQTTRSASGVLHALYVFTVIDSWLEALPASAHEYSKLRRDEIAVQISEIRDFAHAELTGFGAALRDYLFSKHQHRQTSE